MFTGDGKTALDKDLLALAQYLAQSKVSNTVQKDEKVSAPHSRSLKELK